MCQEFYCAIGARAPFCYLSRELQVPMDYLSVECCLWLWYGSSLNSLRLRVIANRKQLYLPAHLVFTGSFRAALLEFESACKVTVVCSLRSTLVWRRSMPAVSRRSDTRAFFCRRVLHKRGIFSLQKLGNGFFFYFIITLWINFEFFQLVRLNKYLSN